MKDYHGSLTTHAYDIKTGKLSGPQVPSKLPATQIDASPHINGGIWAADVTVPADPGCKDSVKGG